MATNHDWHLFDQLRGYEVRRLDADRYEARRVGEPEIIIRLTAAEFEQWREEGPNPKGLD
jgi:hypothetical protein